MVTLPLLLRPRRPCQRNAKLKVRACGVRTDLARGSAHSPGSVPAATAV